MLSYIALSFKDYMSHILNVVQNLQNTPIGLWSPHTNKVASISYSVQAIMICILLPVLCFLQGEPVVELREGSIWGTCTPLVVFFHYTSPYLSQLTTCQCIRTLSIKWWTPCNICIRTSVFVRNSWIPLCYLRFVIGNIWMLTTRYV